MPAPKRTPNKLPSAAELKRIILILRHAGLDITMIELAPNQIRVRTSSTVETQDQGLSAYDEWKMKTEQDQREVRSTSAPIKPNKTQDR